jgi:hypothetical protein
LQLLHTSKLPLSHLIGFLVGKVLPLVQVSIPTSSNPGGNVGCEFCVEDVGFEVIEFGVVVGLHSHLQVVDDVEVDGEVLLPELV